MDRVTVGNPLPIVAAEKDLGVITLHHARQLMDVRVGIQLNASATIVNEPVGPIAGRPNEIFRPVLSQMLRNGHRSRLVVPGRRRSLLAS